MEYPQDPATFALDDEFLIGETQNSKTTSLSTGLNAEPQSSVSEHTDTRVLLLLPYIMMACVGCE